MTGTIVMHAVEAGDLRPGAVDVLPHADAHVQPGVAVDDVVAAAALMMSLPSPPRMMLPVVNDGDTALPNAVSRSSCRPSMSAILVSALPLTPRADLAADQIDGVVAAQEVVVRRARQAFHDVEAGEGRRTRTRHRRLIEEAADRSRWSRRSCRP